MKGRQNERNQKQKGSKKYDEKSETWRNKAANIDDTYKWGYIPFRRPLNWPTLSSENEKNRKEIKAQSIKKHAAISIHLKGEF